MINEKQIKQIEKIFSIEYISKSRIDGYPIFKIRKDDVDDLKDFFEIELIYLLEDHIAGFMGIPNSPIQMKNDVFMIKITEIKKDFIKYIRKEKLKKLEIVFFHIFIIINFFWMF